MTQIPTITIKQPWATLIARGFKGIETRSHSRFRGLVGLRIGIHAGRGYDWAGHEIASRHLSPEELATLPRGAIIATAHVIEARALTPADEPQALIECKTRRYGLILADIVRIVPVPAKGYSSVWRAEVGA